MITLIEFQEVYRSLYSGAKVLGVNMLKWELAENMTRPNSRY